MFATVLPAGSTHQRLNETVMASSKLVLVIMIVDTTVWKKPSFPSLSGFNLSGMPSGSNEESMDLAKLELSGNLMTALLFLLPTQSV